MLPEDSFTSPFKLRQLRLEWISENDPEDVLHISPGTITAAVFSGAP